MGAPTPLVSVVIAAYNVADHLPATMRSILAQTFGDFEVVVVDDGSTDATGEILDRFAELDARVVPVHRPTNSGRSAARNHGLGVARGEWICPMDADDLWFRGRLRELVAASRRYPGTEAFTDDLIEFTPRPDGTVALGHRHVSSVSWWMGGDHQLDRGPWFRDRECHMRAFIRRDLIERHGITFPEELSAGEDLAFYIRVAFAGDAPPPVRVAQANYYYRVGHSQRAANMAEARVRLSQLVVESTGDPLLAELVERTNPARVFMSARADRLGLARGTSSGRDSGLDGMQLETSALAGYAQLARNKVLEVVGNLADRHLRPGIAADIAAQLSVPAPPG